MFSRGRGYSLIELRFSKITKALFIKLFALTKLLFIIFIAAKLVKIIPLLGIDSIK